MSALTPDGHAVLKRASPAQTKRAHEAIFKSMPNWRGHLDVQGFLDKVHLMIDTMGYQSIPWVLVPAHEPETLDTIYAVATTFRRFVYHVAPSSTRVVKRPVIGIATLWVPEEHRGAALAFLTISLLRQIFVSQSTLNQTSREMNDLFAFGNNEVQDGFYTRLGALKMQSDETIWPIEPLLTHNIQYEVAPIHEDDLARIADLDCAMLKRALPHTGASDTHRFAFIPESTVYEHMVAMARFNAERDARKPAPEAFGAEIVDRTEKAFIVWTRCWPENTLQIVRLRAAFRQQLVALIRAAQLYAREQGLRQVRAWAVDRDLLEANEHSVRRGEELWDLVWLDGASIKQDKLVFHIPEMYAATSCGELYG